MEKKISVDSTYFQHARNFHIFMQNNKKEIKFKLAQKKQHICLLSFWLRSWFKSSFSLLFSIIKVLHANTPPDLLLTFMIFTYGNH